jgi:hypothetical protein
LVAGGRDGSRPQRVSEVGDRVIKVSFISLFFCVRCRVLTLAECGFENNRARHYRIPESVVGCLCLTNYPPTYRVLSEPRLAHSLLQLLWNHPVHLNPIAHLQRSEKRRGTRDLLMSGPLDFRSQSSTSLPLKLEAGITRRCRERGIVRLLSSKLALQQNNGDASGTYVNWTINRCKSSQSFI